MKIVSYDVPLYWIQIDTFKRDQTMTSLLQKFQKLKAQHKSKKSFNGFGPRFDKRNEVANHTYREIKKNRFKKSFERCQYEAAMAQMENYYTPKYKSNNDISRFKFMVNDVFRNFDASSRQQVAKRLKALHKAQPNAVKPAVS